MTEALPAPEEKEKPPFQLEDLSTEVGWLLVGVGILGVLLPGLPAAPFLIAGGAVVVPGGKKRLSRWIAAKPRPGIERAMRPLARFVDDLETRYPRGR